MSILGYLTISSTFFVFRKPNLLIAPHTCACVAGFESLSSPRRLRQRLEIIPSIRRLAFAPSAVHVHCGNDDSSPSRLPSLFGSDEETRYSSAAAAEVACLGSCDSSCLTTCCRNVMSAAQSSPIQVEIVLNKCLGVVGSMAEEPADPALEITLDIRVKAHSSSSKPLDDFTTASYTLDFLLELNTVMGMCMSSGNTISTSPLTGIGDGAPSDDSTEEAEADELSRCTPRPFLCVFPLV
mmetsp:Transcript_6205/g.9882  ORF Transcript_6205/g.9882 Transcript_6205/m.9882 type:complete len:239 (-) Transcript_6205:294-1010(-)